MDGVQKFRPDSIKLKLQYRTDEKEAWKDVSKVASQSELDKTGTKVETTSVLDRILTGSNGDDSVTTWEKDSSGNAVVWENLPAYVNNGKMKTLSTKRINNSSRRKIMVWMRFGGKAYDVLCG